MVCRTSKASDQPVHMHSLMSLEYSMILKLLTEHRLDFVSCTGSTESTLVKMPHCWKSHVAAQASRCVGYIHISKKRKNSDKYHKYSFSCMQCAVSCLSSLKLFFAMQTHEKETQLGNYVCVLSPLSCAKATACYPSLKKTTTRGLIVGFFDLKHVSVNHYPVLLSAADTISSAGPRVGPGRHPPLKEAVTN